jgi:hypothetical protein
VGARHRAAVPQHDGQPGACVAETSTPIAVTTQYNDPTQLRFDPPLALDDPDPAQRTFKFCALYDNGHRDPNPREDELGVADPADLRHARPGGPCLVPCRVPRGLGHRVSQRGQARHACDATRPASRPTTASATARPARTTASAMRVRCRGGVTTGDEMFIPLGSYYCDPSVPGQTCTGGLCATTPSGARAARRTPTAAPAAAASRT